jgi:hypothetical protein
MLSVETFQFIGFTTCIVLLAALCTSLIYFISSLYDLFKAVERLKERQVTALHSNGYELRSINSSISDILGRINDLEIKKMDKGVKK